MVSIEFLKYLCFATNTLQNKNIASFLETASNDFFQEQIDSFNKQTCQNLIESATGRIYYLIDFPIDELKNNLEKIFYVEKVITLEFCKELWKNPMFCFDDDHFLFKKYRDCDDFVSFLGSLDFTNKILLIEWIQQHF